MEYYQGHIQGNPAYEFAGIYADEGISGTSLKKRNAFNQMMEDARAGKLDLILTKSVSRFGRNTVDTLRSIRELKELHVDVFFEKENIHTNDSKGELLLSILSAAAEQESFSLSGNVKWGNRRNYERGKIQSVASGKFLGYTKDENKNLIIREDKAETVRRIYREFLGGYGIAQIAERLMADKVPNTFDQMGWEYSHIYKVLTNEKIKGDFRFQKTFITDPITQKRVINTGQLPSRYLENTHPAIIDKGTWECVQLEMARQREYCKKRGRRRFHDSNESRCISGRMTCQVCGNSFMQLQSKRKGDIGRVYWRCSSFLGRKGTLIPGMSFTPEPNALSYMGNDRKKLTRQKKERKLPKPRPMLCTDIQIQSGAPEDAFIRAANSMIKSPAGYIKRLEKQKNEGNALERHRAKELLDLLLGGKELEGFDYPLSLRLVDHFEVTPEGKILVIFLAGIEILI